MWQERANYHPQEQICWAAACDAQMILTNTDPNDALDNLEDEGLEYMRIEAEIGELIHVLGDQIIQGRTKIGALTKEDGVFLSQIGHVLWGGSIGEGIRALDEVGINPYESLFLVGVAHRLIGNCGLISTLEAVKEEIEFHNK